MLQEYILEKFKKVKNLFLNKVCKMIILIQMAII